MPGRNQGEGDRASARKYNEKTRSFAESGEVGPKAKAAHQDDAVVIVRHFLGKRVDP